LPWPQARHSRRDASGSGCRPSCGPVAPSGAFTASSHVTVAMPELRRRLLRRCRQELSGSGTAALSPNSARRAEHRPESVKAALGKAPIASAGRPTVMESADAGSNWQFHSRRHPALSRATSPSLLLGLSRHDDAQASPLYGHARGNDIELCCRTEVASHANS